MKPLCIAFIAAAVSVMTPAASSVQSRWIRIDSPNFVVLGEIAPRDLRDIAVKFEGFRETLGRLMNERVLSTAVPTVVTVFASDRTFRPFMPTFKGKRVEVSGLFVPRQDVNHILMVAERDNEDLRVIFHEYAHLLINNTGLPIPVWLSEGLAEYYSTFELGSGGRYALIGNVIGPHVGLLSEAHAPLLLADLLKVTHDSPLYNEGSRRSVLYAKSWALTHLILQTQPSLMPQLRVYLQEMSRGVESGEAWKQAFGAQDMEGILDRYMRRGSFTATQFKFSERIAAFEAPAVPVPPVEAEALLADVLVELDDVEGAAARLARAAKADATNVRVALTTIRQAIRRGDVQNAPRDLRALPAQGDWFLSYQAGIAVGDLVSERKTPPTTEELELARRYFGEARANRPEFPNAAASFAALETRSPSGPTAETRQALERAQSMAPGRYDYSWTLAHVLARQGAYEAARNVVGPLLSPLHPEHVRASARTLMGQIVEREAAATKYASSDRPPSDPAARSDALSGARTSPPPATTTNETTMTRPVFRQIGPGEQRFEGTLEQIECNSKTMVVTFHVKAGAETIMVTSPSLTGVEFLTYRDDLKGRITCGPLKPSLPVYVTWKPGAAAGSRLAVAIEFLPKS